jgi:hypothetical protein
MKKNVLYVAIAIMSWILLYSAIDIYSYTVKEGVNSPDDPVNTLDSSANPAISLGSPPNYGSSTESVIPLGSSTKRGNRKKFASFNKNNKISNNTKEIAELKGKMAMFSDNNVSLLKLLQTNISQSIDKNKPSDEIVNSIQV